VQSWGFYGPPPMIMWGGTVDERASVPSSLTTCRTSQMTGDWHFSYRAANWRGWFLFLSCFDYQCAEHLFLDQIPWSLGFGQLPSGLPTVNIWKVRGVHGRSSCGDVSQGSSVAARLSCRPKGSQANKLLCDARCFASSWRPVIVPGTWRFSDGDAIPKYRCFERHDVLG